MKKTFVSVDIVVLLAILLSAIVLGSIAHELFHIFTISKPSELTVHWGNLNFFISTCCLNENEAALENVAYIIQFIVMGLWAAFAFKHAFVKKKLD